ncbi:MAG: pilus assembly protein CpaF, partial [Jatrophihabitans sp.]
FTTADLVAAGTLPADLCALLEAVVAARLGLLVSGGTGSGKTTLLGALLGTVDPAQRLVLIEDVPELVVAHPHVVRLRTRAANIEGAGEVGLRDLVRQALRMRPDRLVVGEFRGPEAVDLLVALNTGHEGGAATVHANSIRDVPSRLAALAILGGLPGAAVGALACGALQVLAHLRRTDGGRAVCEVGLVQVASGGDPVVRPVWRAGTGYADGIAELRALIGARGVAPP